VTALPLQTVRAGAAAENTAYPVSFFFHASAISCRKTAAWKDVVATSLLSIAAAILLWHRVYWTGRQLISLYQAGRVGDGGKRRKTAPHLRRRHRLNYHYPTSTTNTAGRKEGGGERYATLRLPPSNTERWCWALPLLRLHCGIRLPR